jgi:hypothetical protein
VNDTEPPSTPADEVATSEAAPEGIVHLDDLSPDELRVMDALVDNDTLAFFSKFSVAVRDIDFPNRGYRYVPRLMAACLSMIDRGIMLISYYDGDASKWVILSAEESRAIVSDINNWWRYDPAVSGDDPDDDGTNPIPGGLLGKVDWKYHMHDPLWGVRPMDGWRHKTNLEPLPSPSQAAAPGRQLAEDNQDFVAWVEELATKHPVLAPIVRRNTDPYPQMQGAWIFQDLASWVKGEFAADPNSVKLREILRDINEHLDRSDDGSLKTDSYTYSTIGVEFVQYLWGMPDILPPNLEALYSRINGKR